MSLPVFHNHELLAEYPDDHLAQVEPETEDLLILARSPRGQLELVRRFRHGQWSGSGPGLLCAGPPHPEALDACPRCRRLSVD